MPRKLTILTVVLAATFVATGLSKLASVSPSPENFARWGFSTSFMYLIGAVELVGGIALLVPRISVFAALGLVATMFGALRTGIAYGEPLHIALPVVLLILLAVVVYARRDQLVSLIRLVRRRA